MNLNDEYLPYKHIIGQVIMDVGVRIHSTMAKTQITPYAEK